MKLKQTRMGKKIHSVIFFWVLEICVFLIYRHRRSAAVILMKRILHDFLLYFFCLKCFHLLSSLFLKILSNIAELRCQLLLFNIGARSIRYKIKTTKNWKKNFILYSHATSKPPGSGWTENKWAHARRDCTKQNKTNQHTLTHIITLQQYASNAKTNQHIPSFSRYVNEWNVMHVRRYAYVAYYAVLYRF